MSGKFFGFACFTSVGCMVPVMCYYFGLVTPMVKDVSIHAGHRSFMSILMESVDPGVTEGLAPHLAGFSASAAVCGLISVGLLIGAVAVRGGKGWVLGACGLVMAFTTACLACTAIALSQYQEMVVAQTLTQTVQELHITMGVMMGIVAITAAGAAICSASSS